MKNRLYVLWLTVLLFIFTVPSIAQQSTGLQPEKAALINEIRNLAGLTRYIVKPKIENKGSGTGLSAMVEKDTTLTEDQKAQLRPLVAEITEKIEKDIRAYAEDESITTKMFEQVSIDHFDKAFDEAELKELLVFLRTPTGKKAFLFFRDFNSRAMKSFTESYGKAMGLFIQSKFDEGARQIRERIRELKAKQLVAEMRGE